MLDMKIGIKDGYNSTAALYVDSITGCDFYPSQQGAPPQNNVQNIWDPVGSYVMHTFLAHQLRAISNILTA
jgi:hypothetical protein